MWLKIGHWGVFAHTPEPKEWSQYLISVVKETTFTPVMNRLCSAADLRQEHLEKSYSAPGEPHLKYDPEPNTYSKNCPTIIHAGFSRDHTPVFH